MRRNILSLLRAWAARNSMKRSIGSARANALLHPGEIEKGRGWLRGSESVFPDPIRRFCYLAFIAHSKRYFAGRSISIKLNVEVLRAHTFHPSAKGRARAHEMLAFHLLYGRKRRPRIFEATPRHSRSPRCRSTRYYLSFIVGFACSLYRVEYVFVYARGGRRRYSSVGQRYAMLRVGGFRSRNCSLLVTSSCIFLERLMINDTNETNDSERRSGLRFAILLEYTLYCTYDLYTYVNLGLYELDPFPS